MRRFFVHIATAQQKAACSEGQLQRAACLARRLFETFFQPSAICHSEKPCLLKLPHFTRHTLSDKA
jgi:hypothetical protein